MTTIPLTQLKKDNTNLFRCGAEGYKLSEALKKDEFKKVTPEKIDRLTNYLLVTNAGEVNPYPSLDLRMDLDRFKETLDDNNRRVFVLFLQGYSPNQISLVTKHPVKTVYSKLSRITELFKQFYQEG